MRYIITSVTFVELSGMLDVTIVVKIFSWKFLDYFILCTNLT